jgi:competence protein ComEC
VVYLPRYPEVSYGDSVVVEGVVSKDKLNEVSLIKIQEGQSLLYQIRKKLIEVYRKSLPEPHSSFLAGLTLGSKAGLPKEFWEQLKKTGTAHVVVASGMNVTLVAGFLMNLLILLMPRRRAVLAALVGIWGYSVLSGFDAPIVRAAVMGSIGFSAQAIGRLYDAWRGLFLSALGILFVKPEWVSDLGFILSFVATASLMLFEKRIRKKVQMLPKVIREGFSTSLAAQIGVAPILFVTFGQFNLLSPLINALVLWTIAPITIIGMIGGSIGLFVPLLGRLILFITFPMTSWFMWIVSSFS